MRKLLVIVALIFAHTAWGGDFEDGLSAANRGDHATAFRAKRNINPRRVRICTHIDLKIGINTQGKGNNLSAQAALMQAAQLAWRAS